MADVFSFVRTQLLAERMRWPLWLPVGLGTGVGAYFALPEEPSAWAAAAALAAFALLLTIRSRFRPALLLLAALVLGFAAAKARTEWVSAPVLERKIGPIRIVGRVIESSPRGKGLRLLLEPDPIRRLRGATPARIRVTGRVRDALPAPGSFVRVTAVLMPPPGPATPGSYDFGRWAYFQRIGAVGYLYGKPHAIPPPHDPSLTDDLADGIEVLRTRMTNRIREALPGPEGAIAAALITGARAEISEEDDAAYRDSGLYHVLSISGLHLALAGGIFFWTIRALLALFPYVALRWPVKKIAAVAALIGAAFYLTISGCDMPAVRAFVMLAAMFLAVLFDRPALSMRNVALAASLVLLFAPESLLDAGSQMSFASVIGLIALAEAIAARPKSVRRALPLRLAAYAAGIAAVSLVAGIYSAPIAIHHFERAAPYGLVANLAAEPVVGFLVMPAATAAMVLMPFGLDAWPLELMGMGVAAMTDIARWTARLPGAGSLVPTWPLGCLIAVMAGLMWIALWRRRWRWLGLVPAAVGAALAPFARPPDVLVARDFGAVAVRLTDGKLALLGKPKDEFAASVWLRREGDARTPAEALAQDGVRCDAFACIARARGGLVAFDMRPDALFEDCRNARLVVSLVPVRGMCSGAVHDPEMWLPGFGKDHAAEENTFVIDRFDMLRTGGYAVWLEELPRFETVAEARGVRPWSPPWRPRRWTGDEEPP